MDILSAIADAIPAPAADRSVLVGIDGIDGAGKTTLADALAERIDGPVLRVSIDDFHRPRAERLTRGPLSPEGYYHDSFDYDFFTQHLLRPLKTPGPVRVCTRRHDLHADAAASDWVDVAPGSVVVVDGVFLQRPVLVDFWDLVVFVDVDFETSLRRGVARDAAWMGGVEKTRQRYLSRYLPGQALYLAEADPLHRADVVIDNRDLHRPRVVRPE